VLFVFVVAVVGLIAVGTRPSVSGDAAPPPSTTTTIARSTGPTTTTTTVPHGSVTVVVANATDTNGLAGHYTTVLSAGGWNMQTAADAATTVPNSVVYYAAGLQGSADAIAATLGLKSTAVQPLTTGVPVSGVSGIDVVVVIGADLVTQAAS
jgi:hypothetical protein